MHFPTDSSTHYPAFGGLWYDPAVDFNHDDLISEKAVLPTHRWGCRKAHNLLIVALLTSNVHKSKLYIYKYIYIYINHMEIIYISKNILMN